MDVLVTPTPASFARFNTCKNGAAQSQCVIGRSRLRSVSQRRGARNRVGPCVRAALQWSCAPTERSLPWWSPR
eukprot:8414411-Pyramimonas_sp.AAC.1